jgi:beta-glucosidase
MNKVKNYLFLFILIFPIFIISSPPKLIHPTKGWSTLPEKQLKKVLTQIIDSLTLEEKINIIGGNNNFGIVSIDQFKLRKTNYADASCGIRMRPQSTAFPCTLALAATMNQKLAGVYGKSIGEECRHFGVDYLLGPGMNMYRVHQCGRNFEYLGADPYLASRMIVNYVKGLQSMGVGATLKHFVTNNTDWNRCTSNSVVSERALREIYFPAFKAGIIEGRAAAVMTSYNLLNGERIPYSHKLITGLLRKEWGFKGFVMSDWASIYDSKKAFDSGLDQECPAGKFFSQQKLMQLIKEKPARAEELDRKVSAILTRNFILGIYDRPEKDLSFQANHPATAQKVVLESVILLKNNQNILPISPKKYKTVLLLGKNLGRTSATGGGAAMYKNKQYTNNSIARSLFKLTGDRIRYTGIDEESGLLKPYQKTEIKKLSKEADLVIVGIGTDFKIEKEGADAPYSLPAEQYELVDLAFKNNKKTVVICVSGRGIDFSPFADKVLAILQVFFPGEHGGKPIAEILSGKANPCGKLPFTLGKTNRDHHYYNNYLPRGAKFYPEARYGLDPRLKIWDLNYQEGIFTDYRWFEAKGIKPLFPFGAGLSYSAFSYQNMKIYKSAGCLLEVSIEISNQGPYPGKEVVQCYVEDVKSSLERPLKELKGFAKIFLKVGESKTVRFKLQEQAFSFYSTRDGKWIIENGEFRIHIGRSSQDIRCRKEYTLTL